MGKKGGGSGIYAPLWVFLVNMNYRGFASSDLPRPSVIIEEAAAGQRPSGSSAAGENNCYFQINVSTTKKKEKKAHSQR